MNIESIIWSSNSWLNVLIKMALIGLTVWSGYELFGPANLIAHLEK